VCAEAAPIYAPYSSYRQAVRVCRHCAGGERGVISTTAAGQQRITSLCGAEEQQQQEAPIGSATLRLQVMHAHHHYEHASMVARWQERGTSRAARGCLCGHRPSHARQVRRHMLHTPLPIPVRFHGSAYVEVSAAISHVGE
jgi:hypothetical protein